MASSDSLLPAIDPAKAPDSDIYVLPRDYNTAARLSLWHWHAREREGWLIYPKITRDLQIRSQSNTPNPLRIADVAAGNALWSCHVLKEHPTAEVTAFDLSTAAFPKPRACPDGLRLEAWNMFHAVPHQYQDYFDIVHVRYILGSVHAGGRDIVIKNLVTMLKPGGWLQWQDAYPPAQVPVDNDTLQPVSEAEWPTCVKIFGEVTGIWKNTMFIHRLDEVIKEIGGLEETERFAPPVQRELLTQETATAILLYEDMMRGAMSKLANEGQRREMLRSMVHEGERIDNGTHWTYCLMVAVGRKPFDKVSG